MNSKTLISQAIEMALPVSIHWDLTWRCDHKCVHCYLTDREQPELSYDECVRILDELVEAGTLTLLFSGGDPFLRPDAIDILRAARARDFVEELVASRRQTHSTGTLSSVLLLFPTLNPAVEGF